MIDCPESDEIPCSLQNDVEPTCVSELQICDGITDCPNGDDESNCANGEYIHVYMHMDTFLLHFCFFLFSVRNTW